MTQAFLCVVDERWEAILERLDPPGSSEAGKDAIYHFHYDENALGRKVMSVGNTIAISFDGRGAVLSVENLGEAK